MKNSLDQNLSNESIAFDGIGMRTAMGTGYDAQSKTTAIELGCGERKVPPPLPANRRVEQTVMDEASTLHTP